MRIPAQGPLDTLFKRLVDYIEPDYPEWPSMIQPASTAQIKQLYEAAHLGEIGRDFPPAYRIFLEHMGADDGGLITEWDGFGLDISVDKLIDFHQDLFCPDGFSDSWQPDPHWLCFLHHWTDCELYFDLHQGENPTIYLGQEKPEYFSSCFENYLFQKAFYQIQKRLYSAQVDYGTSQLQMEFWLRRQAGVRDVTASFSDKRQPWLSDTPGNSLGLLEQILEPFGLQKLWFSDAANYIGVCGDVSVIAHGANSFWAVFLGAPYQKAAEIAHAVKQALYLDQKTFFSLLYRKKN